MTLLEVERVTAGYGDSVVLDDISFALAPGERLALLGRNGVGKTTLVRTIMGLTRLHHGRLRWAGTELTALSTFQRARAGIGWVPQERAVFPSLTVAEHLDAVARPGAFDAASIYRIFPRLGERREHRGQQLSGGEQQMLAIARALVTNPRLLLMDEPLEGLAPLIAQEVTQVVRELGARATMGIVLVEQHARLALSLTERALVLDRGKVVHHGASAALLADVDTMHRLLTVS
jgi:branched-chain amino acid transport system ATP-binding protein